MKKNNLKTKNYDCMEIKTNIRDKIGLSTNFIAFSKKKLYIKCVTMEMTRPLRTSAISTLIRVSIINSIIKPIKKEE